jgi:hypothetical protein
MIDPQHEAKATPPESLNSFLHSLEDQIKHLREVYTSLMGIADHLLGASPNRKIDAATPVTNLKQSNAREHWQYINRDIGQQIKNCAVATERIRQAIGGFDASEKRLKTTSSEDLEWQMEERP